MRRQARRGAVGEGLTCSAWLEVAEDARVHDGAAVVGGERRVGQAGVVRVPVDVDLAVDLEHHIQD